MRTTIGYSARLPLGAILHYRIAPLPIIVAVLLAGLHAGSTLHAQQAAIDPALAAKLQTTIEQQRERWGTPGITAAVIIPGMGKWLGASGISAEGVPMEPGMLLGAGSITKTFTAAAILQLAEEGKLSLDDSLHRWLPAHPYIDSTITIRQLLGHTAGLSNYTENEAWGMALNADPTRIFTPEEIVSYTTAPYFAPGKGWRYSNTGYTILGMIMTKAAGADAGPEFRRRFFNPFGLTHTFLDVEEEEAAGEFAHPWSDFTGDDVPEDVINFPRPALYSSAWTAGGIISTSEDLAEWGRALYGGRVLSASSMTQMLTFRNLQPGSGIGYGLGVSRNRASGKSIYGHGGNIVGYSSIMFYYPEDSIVVAAMVNGEVNAEPIGIALMNAILTFQPSSVAEKQDPAYPAAAITHAHAENGVLVVDYRLNKSAASLKLYDAFGREVETLATGGRGAGTYSTRLKVAGHPHGVYFLRLQSGETMVTRKVVL